MEIIRGETRTLSVTIPAAEIVKLPAEFNMLFTVKKLLDTDDNDSKAIIQKSKAYPTDFTEDDGDYSTNIVLTATDTLQPDAVYKYDFRFVTADKNFIKTSTGGKFTINLSPTQRQSV